MTTFEDPRSQGVYIEGETTAITFEYEQPDITVQSSARYVDHEVIGGMTVRQKVGEDPINVDINGLCTRDEAASIDRLHEEDYVEFYSYRTGTKRMQVRTTETQPIAEGGGVAITNNSQSETIHEFTISLIEA